MKDLINFSKNFILYKNFVIIMFIYILINIFQNLY